ncbi:hypothetical protein U3516DRAFT_809318 [Neocallimastix sp. 'constans']|jgi:hypothetical protein
MNSYSNNVSASSSSSRNDNNNNNSISDDITTIDLTDDIGTNTNSSSRSNMIQDSNRSFNIINNNIRRRNDNRRNLLYVYENNTGGFPVQLAPSIVLPRRVLPSRIMNEHYSNLHFRNYNDIDNTPSTLAGRAIEEARNEESDNSVKYKNIKCSICLCNPTVGTRLDSTICGHVFCHDCLAQALKVSKRCPTCRHFLRNRYSVHPLYTE